MYSPAGLHGQLTVIRFHDQGPSQDDREFVKLRALSGLSPASGAAHMSDANSGLACAGPPDILIDQLWRIPSRGNAARLADQFRHDRQYSARHGKLRAARLVRSCHVKVGHSVTSLRQALPPHLDPVSMAWNTVASYSTDGKDRPGQGRSRPCCAPRKQWDWDLPATDAAPDSGAQESGSTSLAGCGISVRRPTHPARWPHRGSGPAGDNPHEMYPDCRAPGSRTSFARGNARPSGSGQPAARASPRPGPVPLHRDGLVDLDGPAAG